MDKPPELHFRAALEALHIAGLVTTGERRRNQDLGQFQGKYEDATDEILEAFGDAVSGPKDRCAKVFNSPPPHREEIAFRAHSATWRKIRPALGRKGPCALSRSVCIGGSAVAVGGRFRRRVEALLEAWPPAEVNHERPKRPRATRVEIAGRRDTLGRMIEVAKKKGKVLVRKETAKALGIHYTTLSREPLWKKYSAECKGHRRASKHIGKNRNRKPLRERA